MILLAIIAFPVVEWWDNANVKARIAGAALAAVTVAGLVALAVTR